MYIRYLPSTHAFRRASFSRQTLSAVSVIVSRKFLLIVRIGNASVVRGKGGGANARHRRNTSEALWELAGYNDAVHALSVK